MSQRFDEYLEAYRFAFDRANQSGLDVAIRRVKELRKDGFNVSYAAWMCSDYALAEIVTPRGWRCPTCGWIHNNTTSNPTHCGKCKRLR